MKAVIFKTQNNSSQRKIRDLMIEGDIEHIERNISRTPLTKEEYLEIITKHEGGISGLFSRNANRIIDELLEDGVDIEKLSIMEFHDIVVKHPNIWKSPITIYGDVVLGGYDVDEAGILIPREVRQREMDSLLRSARLCNDESA